MTRTSALNCLSCRHPYQTPDSLNCLPLFTGQKKTLFHRKKCFVASPSTKIGSENFGAFLGPCVWGSFSPWAPGANGSRGLERPVGSGLLLLDAYHWLLCSILASRRGKTEPCQAAYCCDPDCLVQTPFRASGPKWEKNGRKMDSGRAGKMGEKWPKNFPGEAKIHFSFGPEARNGVCTRQSGSQAY